MSDILVIAEEELVLAFRLIGLDGVAVSGRDEALQAFQTATGIECGGAAPSSARKIVILTAEIAQTLDSEIHDWRRSGAYPLVVEIPSQNPEDSGRRSIGDALRRSVGFAI